MSCINKTIKGFEFGLNGTYNDLDFLFLQPQSMPPVQMHPSGTYNPASLGPSVGGGGPGGQPNPYSRGPSYGVYPRAQGQFPPPT